MNIRCFIAVELPGEIKQTIASKTDGLKKSGADAKWVRAENLHLTLKFLGSTPEEAIPDIKEALLDAAKGHGPFRMRLKGTGVFPDRKRPRVVWVGIEGSENLVAIQKDVEGALSKLGYEPEGRAYSPHLTIGRLKSLRRRDILLKEIDALSDEDFGVLEVSEISIMKSTLKPSGAEYSRLFSAPLGS